MSRQCACGSNITHRPTWQAQCYPCWLQANPGRGNGAARAYATGQRAHSAAAPVQEPQRAGELMAALYQANTELKHAQAQVAALRLQLAASQAQCAGLLRRVPRDYAPPATLAAYLPKLVRLCHPDRHAGSQVANECTAWLLGLRGKLLQ